MRFSDRAAIVIGASRGVGQAIALGLAGEGGDVCSAAQSIASTLRAGLPPGTRA